MNEVLLFVETVLKFSEIRVQFLHLLDSSSVPRYMLKCLLKVMSIKYYH